MMLHTTMPLEMVLQGLEDAQEHFQEVTVQGIRMQITPVAPGIGKIVRLLDCSLNDYLNPELTPGSYIHYS
ncbi:YlzJ-like family protein [Paenibacillus sp. J5C_2022]|uniref:YlzJ-like family protein n=1 Tax=Paenibacillus sp. J5C2022 TaxID=2977129 RepID=UPI0021CF33D5|nr:YlzJ-like family protein [Paenibacillus sp. J5C2022]MCU6707163.1 YlzJ-like family protein [Paenibacillus sp. J5C2022]